MKKNTGFTLIEVLIAMIVLAVGLLGLAGLQATSLRNNQSAYNRIKATQLAYEIADRMRANYTEAKNLTGNMYILLLARQPRQQWQIARATTGCTPAQMALNDLFEWNQAIKIVTNPSVDYPRLREQYRLPAMFLPLLLTGTIIVMETLITMTPISR